MDPQPEAEGKIKRIDKDKSRRMEFEEEDVRRARFLMSPFNLNEAHRHQTRVRAALLLVGTVFVGGVAIMLLLTLCSK